MRLFFAAAFLEHRFFEAFHESKFISKMANPLHVCKLMQGAYTLCCYFCLINCAWFFYLSNSQTLYETFYGTPDSPFTCSFFCVICLSNFLRKHNHFCGSDGCVIFCWSIPQLLHAVFGYFPHDPNSICRCACILLLCMDARVQTTSPSPVPHLNRPIISNR